VFWAELPHICEFPKWVEEEIIPSNDDAEVLTKTLFVQSEVKTHGKKSG
jgi:hypothetical protein